MACSDLWRLVLHLEKALFGGRKAMRVICISIAFFLLLLSFDPGLYLFAVAEDADLVLQAPAEIQKSEMRRQAAAAAAAEAAMTASMPVSSTLEADEEEAEGVPPLGRATGAASSNSGCCGKSAATSQLVNTNSRGCCKNRLASTGGTHHPAEGNKSTCCGVMPMSFQVSTHTVILFKGWETIQPWFFWSSCLLWFFLGGLSVYLKVMRRRLEAKVSTQNSKIDYSKKRCVSNSPLTAGNVLRSLLCTFIYAYDYLLMLVVMTFNVYLFCAVCGGLGFGVFCFGHLLQSPLQKRIASEGKHPSIEANIEVEEFKMDPACCGA